MEALGSQYSRGYDAKHDACVRWNVADKPNSFSWIDVAAITRCLLSLTAVSSTRQGNSVDSFHLYLCHHPCITIHQWFHRLLLLPLPTSPRVILGLPPNQVASNDHLTPHIPQTLPDSISSVKIPDTASFFPRGREQHVTPPAQTVNIACATPSME